jgi:Ala-tRNA(Pro) deacylase
MMLQDYLDTKGISYRLSTHGTAYTSQDLAAQEHIAGRKVIKPVVICVDGKPCLCALPASHRVDLMRLRKQLNANTVELVDEAQLQKLFPDCELGAEPPVGKLYGMPTVMDASLLLDDQVTFQAGSHTTAVTLSMRDYQRLTEPQITDFCLHA